MQYELWYMQEHGATGSIGLSSSSPDAVCWYDVQSDDNEQTRELRQRVLSADETLKRANADERYSQSDLNVALRTLYEIQQTGAKIENYTAYINSISKQYELWYKMEYGSDIPSGGLQNAIQRAITMLIGTEGHYKRNYDTKPVSDILGKGINDFVSYRKSELHLPVALAKRLWSDFIENHEEYKKQPKYSQGSNMPNRFLQGH